MNKWAGRPLPGDEWTKIQVLPEPRACCGEALELRCYGGAGRGKTPPAPNLVLPTASLACALGRIKSTLCPKRLFLPPAGSVRVCESPFIVFSSLFGKLGRVGRQVTVLTNCRGASPAVGLVEALGQLPSPPTPARLLPPARPPRPSRA